MAGGKRCNALHAILLLIMASRIDSAAEDTVQEWHNHFPALPLPQTLRSLLSPLTQAQIQRFAARAKAGTLAEESGAADSLCKAAHAMCEDVEAMPAAITGRWTSDATPDQKDLILATPMLTTYFHERDIVAGATMMLNLHNLYPLRPFLPRPIADSLAFSSDHLPQIAHALGIPLAIHCMLTNMKQTLTDCESPEANGEIKSCATSMESMLDFVASLLGSDVSVMETSDMPGEAAPEMLRVVGVPSQRPAKARSVACHNEMYPYMVYYCHQIHDTKVFHISLQAHDGREVTAIATCHVNTAKWNPNHIAFQVLKAQPGHTDICHFVSHGDLVWVPNV